MSSPVRARQHWFSLALTGRQIIWGNTTQGGAALSIDMALALGYYVSALQAGNLPFQSKKIV
jgi:hypothetical protein